jgi:succinate dehydrogenase/fumarate reductase-like Fe-S protein
MSVRTIRAKVYRFDPTVDKKSRYQEYQVPWVKGTSAMDILDYIYQNLDGTLSYYDHAGCGLGICGRCTGRVNGKPGVFCQVLVEGDITVDPIAEDAIVKDLVVERKAKES